MKKIGIFYAVFICFFSVLPAFAKENVTLLLMYAGWHVNTHRAQHVMHQLAETYGSDIDYYICNVDDPDECKYVRKYHIRTPKNIPSVMIFLNNKLILEKFYDNQSVEELKENIDKIILSHKK